MNEKQLIQLCKKGRLKGQKALVYQYSNILMGLAYRYSSSHEKSKDIVQEIFILLFKKINLYDEEKGNFSGWMKALAVNVILGELRKEKNLFDKKQQYLEIKSKEKDYTLIDSSIEESDLFRLLIVLPQRERLIFNLFAMEGYSHSEIANKLDLTESYSRTLLARARIKLKKAFQDSGKDKTMIYGR